MHNLTQASIPLRLFGAVLALTLIAAVAVTITLTAGPTQAQNADNTYANPQPCGPGAETAFQPEPHEITTGHFALFDAYWESRTPDPGESTGLDPANVGLLHTNTCPPLVTRTTETDRDGNTTTTTSLVASGIDIDEAIFHVENDRKVTVAEGDPDDTNASHLSLFQYLEVDDYANVGDQVWWLRLDDPDLEGNQQSDLTLGFSTERFDEKYWTGVRYEFRLERNPGIDPADHPHLLAYRARLLNLPGSDLIWNSAEAGIASMEMAPGERINDLQWIFTKAGTYEIYAQPVGYVRQADNPPAGAGDDWKPISANDTEPGEVKKYVIHVGPLNEVEPPLLGVSRSVPENSPAGTDVGDLFLAFSESDDLEYSLYGDGHENFAAVATTDADPYSVRIKVAEGANLDYETRSAYDLTLGVTNKIDHESNPDPSLDDTLVVRITLEDVPTAAILQVDNPNPVAGETVTVTAVVTDFGAGHRLNYIFTDSQHVTSSADNSYTIRRDSPTSETVQFSATYEIQDGSLSPPIHSISAEPVSITWRSQ